jgi:hypothetical protein
MAGVAVSNLAETGPTPTLAVRRGATGGMERRITELQTRHVCYVGTPLTPDPLTPPAGYVNSTDIAATRWDSDCQ